MNKKFNNSKPCVNAMKARLAAIQMPACERLCAEAQLERAEAVAEAIVAIARFVKTALVRHVLRPIRRFATALG
jgi:hypothetical protein